MKKSLYSLMCSVLLAFCFSICSAQFPAVTAADKAVMGDNREFITPESTASTPLGAGASFKQTLKAKADGSLSLLWL